LARKKLVAMPVKSFTLRRSPTFLEKAGAAGGRKKAPQYAVKASMKSKTRLRLQPVKQSLTSTRN